MADDRTLGYVYAFLAGWLILVSSNAMAELDGALGATPVNGGPREVYTEFYWGLVLPVVAGSALFGLLFKDAALGDLLSGGGPSSLSSTSQCSIPVANPPRPTARSPWW